MKTQKIVSEQTKKAIIHYLAQSKKYENSYFWSNFGNAKQREWVEKQEGFDYEGDGIKLHFAISISCKNCYVTREIYIDGEKKTAAALKKFIK